MALDLSKYINQRIPLPKEKMSVYELADYLTDEGYEITKITNSPANKLVYVNNQYHITLRGLVRKIGRNKENFSAWEKERKEQQICKSVNIDRNLFDLFAKATNHAPFATWVKQKVMEEIYGCWQSKLVPPKEYELVNGMILVDDGESISFCHISEFQSRAFKLWTRIPSRSNTEFRVQDKKNNEERQEGGV